MPGLTTHTYIVFKSLMSFSPRSDVIKSVQQSNLAVYEHAKTSSGYKRYSTDPACAMAGAAYLGACGPDLFYLETSELGKFIADLMHYNKSGLYMIWCLRNVKMGLAAMGDGLRNDLAMQLAYCLGHVSHIAADIMVHPYVNTIVRAYPDNREDFQDYAGPNSMKMWKFHNVLEQYQDAYVLYRRFFGMESFGAHWRNVNMASAAARYYFYKENWDEWFLVDNARNFYRFKRSFKQALEEDKYRFFLDKNWLLDIDWYYQYTIPDDVTMTATPQLVQGGTYDKNGTLHSPGLFDVYINDAVGQTMALWKEIDHYLMAPQTEFSDPELRPDKKHFPLLRRHWNLDTGFSPVANANTALWTIPSTSKRLLNIAGTLHFTSAQVAAKDDIVIP